MMNNSIIKYAIIGLLVLGTLVASAIVIHHWGTEALARQRAEAKKPWVVREIEKGSKRYWRIPDYPETLTLTFEPWQLHGHDEVTGDGQPVGWRSDPYCQSVIHFTEEELDGPNGNVTRVVWDKPFKAGDKMEPYNLQRHLRVRASRMAGPPVYLKLDMTHVQDSFGYPFGPLGNKLLP